MVTSRAAPAVPVVVVNQYTTLVAPTAWRALETFIPRSDGSMVATEASDVFMLGCTFIEVLAGCTREPYDWLTAEDPSGTMLIAYRVHEATRNNNPLVVMQCTRRRDSRGVFTFQQ